MRPRNQRAVALICEWLIAKQQQFFAERAPLRGGVRCATS
ncbi:hypothetical protein AZ54_17335 [Xanthomonas oryzae pv. oryzae PXO86]|uniref:Uncharacterized protein n=1 Tax=Xanthomonas oryzae pv. oryzae (strain PXO99A) TaxID=360094 RepID=A0A0K0GMW1_XANOP|nr:hypothetical protein PXO_02003 [Xanthomonas oryzae pv. oryzae PXO99A]AJQ85606.1 hypothetical protein AZ54_17335 [Xanthomonas oryzae pv. oryzae PXO86]